MQSRMRCLPHRLPPTAITRIPNGNLRPKSNKGSGIPVQGWTRRNRNGEHGGGMASPQCRTVHVRRCPFKRISGHGIPGQGDPRPVPGIRGQGSPGQENIRPRTHPPRNLRPPESASRSKSYSGQERFPSRPWNSRPIIPKPKAIIS
eukprot:gene15329-biopygen9668